METLEIIGFGLLVVVARAADVTAGTLRMISVVDGRLRTSFALGFVEVLVWLSVTAVVFESITQEPILGLFYAFGFSLGNVIGILVERALPLGNLSLRVVGGDDVREVAKQIRDLGLGATLVKGEGRDGERLLLFSFMPKRQLKPVLAILKPVRERIFYTLDYGGSSNKILAPVGYRPANPRRFFKRK